MKKHFYKTGVDICNARSMYEFLNNHFTYDTMNSWNNLRSIANNVKVYNLGLEGDAWAALGLLRADNYDTVNEMLYDFEHKHKGYEVGFNGRSGGYLVLYNKDNYCNVLPTDHIFGYDSYEDFKEDAKYYYGSVKDTIGDLRYYTQLVRDFDKLCDEIREYVNELSKLNYKQCILEQIVDEFNYQYEDELEELGIESPKIEDGCINVETLTKSLRLALTNVVERFTDSTYRCNEQYLTIDF